MAVPFPNPQKKSNWNSFSIIHFPCMFPWWLSLRWTEFQLFSSFDCNDMKDCRKFPWNFFFRVLYRPHFEMSSAWETDCVSIAKNDSDLERLALVCLALHPATYLVITVSIWLNCIHLFLQYIIRLLFFSHSLYS